MPIGRPPYSPVREAATDFFLSAAALASALSSAAHAGIKPENDAARAVPAPKRRNERRERSSGFDGFIAGFPSLNGGAGQFYKKRAKRTIRYKVSGDGRPPPRYNPRASTRKPPPMSKAQVDPAELRRFAQELNRFNNE